MYRPMMLLATLLALSGCQGMAGPPNAEAEFAGTRCLLLLSKDPLGYDDQRFIDRYANDEHPQCLVALGKLYQRGQGYVWQNFGKARRLYAQASKGSPLGDVALGRMAETGAGEPVDYTKAREHYTLAGQSGAESLGRLQEAGKGGPKDLEAAISSYLRATRYPGDDAWNAMDQLREQGQALTDAQRQQYEQLWMKALVQQQSRALWFSEVSAAVRAAPHLQTGQLTYHFKAGSGTPQITLSQRFGDDKVDYWVMKALSKMSMRSVRPLTDASGTREVSLPLRFTASWARARYPSLCRFMDCSDSPREMFLSQ